MYLPVEGITVHQPLPKIVEKVDQLKQDGQKVIALIHAHDGTNTEELEALQSQLANIHRELGRWGIPLFVHLPYRYPPSTTFALSD